MAWTEPVTRSFGYMVTTANWNEYGANMVELRAGGLEISGQAANRIPYASSTTQLATSAGLTFDGTNLAVGGAVAGTAGNFTTSITINGSVVANTLWTVKVTGSTIGIIGASGGIKGSGASDMGYFAETGKGHRFMVNGSATDVVVIGSSGNVSLSADLGVVGETTFGATALKTHASTGVSIGDATDPGATNLRVAGTTALVGAVTTALKSTGQPGFLAYNSATDAGVASATTLQFDTEVYDELGNFASNIFTATVAGRYLFAVSVTTTVGSVASRGFQLVTSNRTYAASHDNVPSGGDLTQTLSVIADMDVSDTARVNLASSTALTVLGSSTLFTCFSGRLLP